MASGGEIITIINNSGKIIGTGKQLVGIFKEARAAYRDRKDAVKADKAERVAGIKRAQTFNVSQPSHHLGVLEEDEEDEIDRLYEQRAIRDVPHRRHSQDDGRSEASNRSHRSRRPQPAPSTDRDRQMITLTESNLRTHTEVSATTPSAAPAGYRAPYAETAPRDMQLSRPTLTHAATMPLPTPTEVTTPVSTPRQSMVVHRSRSDIQPKKKEIDMDLAYGNVPPDLASRVDLDHDQTRDRAVALSKNSPAPAPMASASTDTSDDPESQAINMIDRIEGLLDEAHCLHHTASSMIAHLQENPQAAAAVALTLAELSALVGKMSPAFLGVIKGGSPAIFALLASPQFLIGTGIAVGVTVLIFGGLKIVKRMTAAREREAPIEMQGMGGAAAPKSEVSYEEALVLEVEEELSTIESWRRGVEPSCIGDDYDEEEEAADVELMSPEADRALREKFQEEVDPWDSVSQAGRSTARSYRSQRSHRSRRPKGEGEDVEVPERKSSKRYYGEGGASEVAESVRSSRSHRSHSSRLSKREEVEEAGKPKEKKNNMLRLLFRKLKEKEQKEKDAGKDKEKSKEKDRESKVGRDKEESTVGRDKESRVGKDRESRVGKDRESRVGKDRESRVGRDKDSSVGRDRESRVGKDRESRVGASRAMSIMA
ncbi:hypothetical protein B0T18DRAFT_168650 [Schizothecium vesticola]|uniref:Gp5/Type VI secretion system Vgr C-terminal trimerisation domain-containing protein n=1 Tax=Schizothecium vesticola TaxID=314040 RepID=A0AA40K1M5_9PEZI|nr:hypothetical protein B0T18DRAFT_168650 [Schizothecium vesticola]